MQIRSLRGKVFEHHNQLSTHIHIYIYIYIYMCVYIIYVCISDRISLTSWLLQPTFRCPVSDGPLRLWFQASMRNLGLGAGAPRHTAAVSGGGKPSFGTFRHQSHHFIDMECYIMLWHVMAMGMDHSATWLLKLHAACHRLQSFGSCLLNY